MTGNRIGALPSRAFAMIVVIGPLAGTTAKGESQVEIELIADGATCYQPGEIVPITVQLNNLTDTEYLVQTFDLSGFDVFGFTEQYYGRPQWWGASLTYRWGP